MIRDNRPVCMMVADYSPSDEFYRYGLWTLTGAPYSDIQEAWESCSAQFAKYVPEEDRTFKDRDRAYVQCMEPAAYYVRIPNGAVANSRMVFCEYHRPRVVENS